MRVREAGGESFADVVIGVSRLEGLERSHQTMDLVEAAVRDRVGPAQVTVHVEPSVGSERANERVAAAALRVPGVVEIHNITVLEGDGTGRAITLHVRLPEDMSLAPAGDRHRPAEGRDRARAGRPASSRTSSRPCSTPSRPAT